jgi:hypothetical protein
MRLVIGDLEILGDDLSTVDLKSVAGVLQINGVPAGDIVVPPVVITGASAGAVVLTIAAHTPQTANLLNITGDSVLGYASEFDKNARLMSTVATVPAGGDIEAGEFTFWLDPTNGAGVFHIAAKTLNGTLVNGSVALA